MGDRPDDTPADDTSVATAEASAPPSDERDSEPSSETQPTVAASTEIDEDVLDVSRELASRVRLQWSIRWAVGAGVAGAIAAGLTYVVGGVLVSLPGGRQRQLVGRGSRSSHSSASYEPSSSIARGRTSSDPTRST